METQTFSPLIGRTQAAPLTKRLLGNSVTTYNKLFCESNFAKQKNFLNLSIFGVKVLAEDIAEVPIRIDEQQKVGDYQSAAIAEYLLRHLKNDDMKFALLFKLKKEELKQFQNGDTTVLKSCLKSIAEGVILNEQTCQVIPNKQLCAIMEKIRQTTKGPNAMQAESIASRHHRSVFTQYQQPTVGDLLQPLKCVSSRKPILCDKATQYERINGMSEGMEKHCKNGERKMLSHKLIQCDRIENGLRSLQKSLREELDVFGKSTECQEPQFIADSITSPIIKALSSTENSIMQSEFPLDVVHTSPPMPEDSLVIIRKKFMDKQFEVQPEEIVLYPQPIYEAVLNVPDFDRDLEWLAEETEPDFYSSTDVDGDSLLALDTPKHDLQKYENYTDCHTENYVQKRSNTSSDHKETRVHNANYVDSSLNDPNNFVSIGSTEQPYGTHIEKRELQVRKQTKIPIPINKKSHFEQLLQKTPIPRIQVGSSKNRFSEKPTINNATIQSEQTEGNEIFTDALCDCQKLSSKEPMEFFEPNYRSDLEKTDETIKTSIPHYQFNQKIKHSNLSTELEEIIENAADQEGIINIDNATEKQNTLHEISPTKQPLIKGNFKNRLSYDTKQRQLVELIARGVEHEMLSDLEKEMHKEF